jgi:hypothetical protein
MSSTPEARRHNNTLKSFLTSMGDFTSRHSAYVHSILQQDNQVHPVDGVRYVGFIRDCSALFMVGYMFDHPTSDHRDSIHMGVMLESGIDEMDDSFLKKVTYKIHRNFPDVHGFDLQYLQAKSGYQVMMGAQFPIGPDFDMREIDGQFSRLGKCARPIIVQFFNSPRDLIPYSGNLPSLFT